MTFRLLWAVASSLVVACGGDNGDKKDHDGGIDSGVEDSGDHAGEDTSKEHDVDAGIDSGVPVLNKGWPGFPWYGCPLDSDLKGAHVVTAFELTPQYFNPLDRRTIEADVDFPTTGDWHRIDMRLELSCPEDGDCDNWDRFASVFLIDPKKEEVLEIERYITPYNIGMCMQTDVSMFGPRLRGKKKIRSFIDTWVGPDEPIHGHGWRITLQFIFHPGESQDGMPSELIQLWPYKEVEIGSPENQIETQIGIKTVALPPFMSKAELRVLTTGHGQGNHMNCAEFCRTEQVIEVDGIPFGMDPWRDNCHENPLDTQAGTWTFARAGWCPGAYVLPHVFDITSAVETGKESTFKYFVMDKSKQRYENICRPGAGSGPYDAAGADAGIEAGSPLEEAVCEGCVFHPNQPGNCEYNGLDHTPPHNRLSVQLLLYE